MRYRLLEKVDRDGLVTVTGQVYHLFLKLILFEADNLVCSSCLENNKNNNKKKTKKTTFLIYFIFEEYKFRGRVTTSNQFKG